ncbi:MAG: hypothetical protein H7256_00830 [Bdellovibrio sp.]|nr:hypothetical protein [Bdellovibrio sp.]
MKIFSNALIGSIILTGSVSFAKVQTTANTSQNNMKSSALSEKNLVEELTGKKTAPVAAQPVNLKNAPLSVQHFAAGQRAMEQKNYILAIKHFNTVIKKYPMSAQVKPALVAKAKVYQEMGLQPQAQRNLKLAQLKTVAKPTATTAINSTQEKSKLTK